MRKFGKYEKMRKNAILQTYITSVLCLALCVTMFFGTSMAWFTDTAESTQNQMYVGTLDIILNHASFKNGSLGGYATVPQVAPEGGNPIIDPAIKWEPGYTAVEKFELIENGDLAFNYQLGIERTFAESGEDAQIAIAKAIDVWNYVGTKAAETTKLPANFKDMTELDEDSDEKADWEKIGTLYEVITEKKAVFSGAMDKDAVTAVEKNTDGTPVLDTNDKEIPAPAKAYHLIALHMEESFADSSVMGKTLDGITIKLVATQKASEQDAFSSAYDDFVFVNTEEKLTDAIVNGETKLLLSEGTYVLPQEAQGKTLQIAGVGDPGDTVLATNTSGSYEGCNYALDGATVVFENITITTDGATYTGYARCNATYNNCVINNTYTLYGNSEFNNCTFNVTGDAYNIWTWGAPNVTFNNCTFNTSGKALLVYNQSCNVTVNKCTFNDNGAVSGKAAIETGVDSVGPKYNIILTGCTVNGFDVNSSGSAYKNIVGNKNNMTAEYLNVIVDGVDVY